MSLSTNGATAIMDQSQEQSRFCDLVFKYDEFHLFQEEICDIFHKRNMN